MSILAVINRAYDKNNQTNDNYEGISSVLKDLGFNDLYTIPFASRHKENFDHISFTELLTNRGTDIIVS